MDSPLVIAQTLARAAGAILREGFGNVHTVRYKGTVDLVTEFDHRSEQLIVSEIRRCFPEHQIYAEESGATGAAHPYVWYVDPLDGTVNFAHGFPVFAVSLALAEHNQPIMGVVYDPLRDELFVAERGQGATLNGVPLRVSAQANLERSLLATGFPYDVRTNPRPNFAEFQAFYTQSQAVRRAGAAALDAAWVAAGRLEGYWEYDIKPWDVGAAALMVREAGGRVTTATGEDDFLGRDSVVVSNGLIHDTMLTILMACAV